MDHAIYEVVLLGLALVDFFDSWMLLLLGAVIAFDLYLSLTDKRALFFSVLQIFGLGGGYFWALSVSEVNDMSGAWVWGGVVGAWTIFTMLFHVWTGLRAPKVSAPHAMNWRNGANTRHAALHAMGNIGYGRRASDSY